MDDRLAMMDGRPAGYDGWMATIHDEWMGAPKWGPGPGGAPFFVLFPSIMDGSHASIIAGRPSIHHGWCWIAYLDTIGKFDFFKQVDILI